MKVVIAFVLFSLSFAIKAQEVLVTSVTPLASVIFETSGLLLVSDRLITHNDSGSEPVLHEVDTADGSVIRTVTITNASCVDWEDICKDETYIYIGDFGNNAGNRTDLKIYRILIEDYLTTTNDSVYASIINFNYADQTDFEPSPLMTNYDAEAIISYGDSLYLFTKNWGNGLCNVYSISKTPGTYTTSIQEIFNPEGLITGASYDPLTNEILFTGYTIFQPFLYLIHSFDGMPFSSGDQLKFTPEIEGSHQIEGIVSKGNHCYYFSSENEGGSASFLHRAKISGLPNNKKPPINVSFYPNPSQSLLTFSTCLNIRLYDLLGNLVLTTTATSIDISYLAAGSYILQLWDTNGAFLQEEKIIKI